MDFPSGLLPGTWLWASHLVFGVVILYALYRAPWWHLRDRESLNVLLGACVATMLVWTLKAGISPGLTIHSLGATTLTLMFGWEFALIAMGVVTLAITIDGGAGWESYTANALVMGTVPVMMSYAVYRIVDRRLPNHFFVYIFLTAYLGGALSIVTTELAAVGLLTLSGVYSLSRLTRELLSYIPLLAFPEGFLNGMIMTGLVVLRPQWVSTFDDHRYLKGK